MKKSNIISCLNSVRSTGLGLAAGGLLLGALPFAATASDMATLYIQGFAGTGPERLAVGVVAKGPGSKRALVFAFTPPGLEGGLANPRLILRSTTGEVLGSNDDWPDSPEAAEIGRLIAATGIEIDDRAAAVIVELPAGSYRAFVDGADGGIGLVAAGVADLEDDHGGSGSSNVGPCTGQEVELPLTNTGAIARAKGKARVRTYADCGQDFRVEIEDVPLGEYGLRVAGESVGTITVVNTGFENEGQIEFDDEANDPHELPLTFEPAGLIEVTRGNNVILRRDFPPL